MKAQPWQTDLAGYPFIFECQTMYAQLDTERHVNNVGVLAFHVEARMRWQQEWLGADSWYSDAVLLRPQRTVTQFIEQVHYGAPVTCAARLVAMDAHGFRLALAVFQNGRCAGVQECRIGAWQQGQWQALPQSMASRLRTALEAPAALMAWPEIAENPPGQWPFQTPIKGRYIDLDPDRIMGELAIYRYLEQARAQPIYAVLETGSGMLIAQLDVRFEHWGVTGADDSLPAAVALIGNSSFLLRCVVQSGERRVASADAVLVQYDRAAQKPKPIKGSLKSKLETMKKQPG